MKKYVTCWFESLNEANKKDKKNIVSSYDSIKKEDLIEEAKLDELLKDYPEYQNAEEDVKSLARKDLNNFISRGKPYLRLKMSFEDFTKLELFMAQFR